MQFEKSGLLMIGTVGVTMGLLMGCSAPDKPDERLQKGDLIMPVYAEGFRWRTCGGGPDAEATCLEILDGDKKAVSVTVYRDSVHWQNDEAFVPGAAVVLGLEHGLTTLSSTHVALMEPWDASLSQWKGGGFLQYVESEAAKTRMRDGETVDFGGNPEWNHEAMIASSFRAFCIYPYGNPLQGEEWAESLPVVPILEYAERTSLGRAEWMKVFAWMVDDQALERANEAFDEITERYQQIQQEPLPTSDSLRVFTGSVDQGKWTAPSGNSFIAHILKDAGARYVFADQKSPENINVSLEKIIELSGRADAWGVVMFQSNTDAITRADLVAQNPQNAFLIPASGRVFVANTAECDYFGWWVAHPDALLRNLRELFYGPNEHVLGTAGLSESKTKACFRWIQE